MALFPIAFRVNGAVRCVPCAEEKSIEVPTDAATPWGPDAADLAAVFELDDVAGDTCEICDTFIEDTL